VPLSGARDLRYYRNGAIISSQSEFYFILFFLEFSTYGSRKSRNVRYSPDRRIKTYCEPDTQTVYKTKSHVPPPNTRIKIVSDTDDCRRSRRFENIGTGSRCRKKCWQTARSSDARGISLFTIHLSTRPVHKSSTRLWRKADLRVLIIVQRRHRNGDRELFKRIEVKFFSNLFFDYSCLLPELKDRQRIVSEKIR